MKEADVLQDMFQETTSISKVMVKRVIYSFIYSSIHSSKVF